MGKACSHMAASLAHSLTVDNEPVRLIWGPGQGDIEGGGGTVWAVHRHNNTKTLMILFELSLSGLFEQADMTQGNYDGLI